MFEKILESCERLFEGRNVGISLVGEDGASTWAPTTVRIGRRSSDTSRFRSARSPASGAAILQRRVVHYPDVEAADVPEYARRGARISATSRSSLRRCCGKVEA